MKIKSQKVLDSFDSPGLCESCGKPCMSRERHHVFTQGSGGPDFRCNIIMIGNAFSCACHTKFHDKALASERGRFLEIVAQREGTTAQAIEDVVNLVRNVLPRGASPWLISELISRLSPEAAELAKRELKFVGEI